MRKTLLALLLCAFGAGAPAHAGYHGADLSDVAQVDILPGWRTDQGSHMTALRVRLAPGWKTYWRAPGEGGIPPRFDWSAASNLSGVAFHWPTPTVYWQNGMRSIGFEDELILPIELFPRQRGQAIGMNGDLEIGVCQDVCIPMQMRFAAQIHGAGSADTRIRNAMAARPMSARQAGMRSITCSLDPISDGVQLTADIEMPALGPGEEAVIELPDQTIWVSEALAVRQGTQLRVTADIVPEYGKALVLDRSTVRTTIISARGAVEIDGC